MKRVLSFKLISFSVLSVIILSSCGIGKNRKESFSDSVYEKVPNYKYGICVDSFFVYHSIVEPNINISQILEKYGISNCQIYEFNQKALPIFDIRKFKAGNAFAVFLNLDKEHKARYFVYEISPIEYLMCEFGDSVKVYKESKKVKTIERKVSCVIENSLWGCIKDNNLNPVLAAELSEMYAWSIDFFAIQKGDHFKVIFNESFVDSLSIGITEIKAVVFNHMGEDIYAIPFEQKGKLDFFNSDGKSLKKAFLKAPLRFSRITSYFSKRRLHPILRILRPHWGVDYAAPIGTPVQAIGGGVVTIKGYRGGGGNTVRIKHNKAYESSYMHLSGFASNIRIGARVQQGQVIGYVGSTGLSTGAHLDFRIFMSGKPVDPLKLVSPPSDPVKKENLPAFLKKSDSLVALLSKIK